MPKHSETVEGQTVALTGDSGVVSGPHVHIELFINAKFSKPVSDGLRVDPQPYILKGGIIEQLMSESTVDLKPIEKSLEGVRAELNGIFQELRANRYDRASVVYQTEFKGLVIQTRVVKQGQKIGVRYLENGKWSSWAIEGDSYGRIEQYMDNGELFQTTLGTNGDLYFRKTKDGKSWSSWALMIK